MAVSGVIGSQRAEGADMSNAVPSVSEEIARLQTLSIGDLREVWRRLHQLPPPKRLSRDLLMRGISYRLQERAFGGLSKATLRRLQLYQPDRLAVERRGHCDASSVKPGTRLVREWHGVTHTVVVLDDGVEWRGKRYRSLSVVAREITGAHWSGPRFFGLTTKRTDG